MNNPSPTPDAGQLQKQIDDADAMHPRYWQGIGKALVAAGENARVSAAVAAIRATFTPDLLGVAKKLNAVPPDINGAPLTDTQVLRSVAEIAANRPRIIAGAEHANGETEKQMRLVEYSVGLDGTLATLAHEEAPEAHKSALTAKEKVMQLGIDARRTLAQLLAKAAQVTEEGDGKKESPAKAFDQEAADEACSQLADLIDGNPALEALLTYEIRVADKFGEPIEAPTNDQKAAVLKQIRGGLRNVKVMRARAAQTMPVEDAVDTLNTLAQVRDVLREIFAKGRRKKGEERLAALHQGIDAPTRATLKKMLDKLPA